VHSRLQDILEAVERIERFVPINLHDLSENKERQVWFVHQLQITGEAARAIPDDVRKQIPSVPWRQWVGLRHILVHEYFGIDVSAVHSVVSKDLAELRRAAKTWLAANPPALD
jgi:uncharacterized protein with HEPN domain